MSDFNKNEFDPKAAAEARKAEMEQITAKLEKGVKDVFNGGNFKEYLNFCAKLPRYSVNNQLLIMMQRPDATMCQSFSNWKDMNRFVKKGEKGIRILAPAPYKMEKEQEKLDVNGKAILDANGEPVTEKVEVTVNAFKPVSTFDISQTEGDPVPMVGVNELSGSVEDYEKLINAIMEVVPVPVSFENIESGAKGYFHLEENRIVIQEGMSEAQTVKTFIHEAAHQALHSREAYDKNDDKKDDKNQPKPIKKEEESKPVVLTKEEIEKRQKEEEAAERKRVSKLAKLYNEMKPEAAADIMTDLDDEIAVAVLQKMDESQAAKVLAALDPGQSARLTRSIYTGRRSSLASPGDQMTPSPQVAEE